MQRISDHLVGKRDLHDETREIRGLQPTHEIGDVSDTIAEDAGKREGLNNWMADDAFSSLFIPEISDFSWAAKRNECAGSGKRRSGKPPNRGNFVPHAELAISQRRRSHV